VAIAVAPYVAITKAMSSLDAGYLSPPGIALCNGWSFNCTSAALGNAVQALLRNEKRASLYRKV